MFIQMTSQWLDPRGSIVSDNYKVHKSQESDRYAIRYKVPSEWNLEINEVRKQDQGIYTCKIFTKIQVINKIVELLVLGN